MELYQVVFSFMSLKIKFVDFWPGFDVNNNYFTNLLHKEWNIENTDSPDYVICSVFGNNYKKYNCTRILFTGENTRPNLVDYHFNFGFDYVDDDRYYRLPLYLIYGSPEELLTKLSFEDNLKQKTKFCSFVVGNPNAKERLEFFDLLCKYKMVDSGGPVRNNIGRNLDPGEKVEWCRQYKFSLCFENSSYPGYTTEKLFQAMQSNTIPIYWGNPSVARDFNPGSFIHVNYGYSDAIELIKEIDKDNDLYRIIYEQQYYPNNQLTEYTKTENILNQFRRIFNGNIR